MPNISPIEQIMAKNEMRLYELGLMKKVESFIEDRAVSEEEKQSMRQELLLLFDAAYSAAYADGVETGANSVLESVEDSVKKMNRE